jgi:hypothetical protein
MQYYPTMKLTARQLINAFEVCIIRANIAIIYVVRIVKEV